MSVDMGKWYMEDLDVWAMGTIWQELGDAKERLHRNATITARFTFDHLDFDLVPDHDGPLTATVDIPIGDIEGAVKNTYDAVKTKFEAYAAGIEAPNGALHVYKAFEWRIQGAVWEMAGY